MIALPGQGVGAPGCKGLNRYSELRYIGWTIPPVWR